MILFTLLRKRSSSLLNKSICVTQLSFYFLILRIHKLKQIFQMLEFRSVNMSLTQLILHLFVCVRIKLFVVQISTAICTKIYMQKKRVKMHGWYKFCNN